MNTIAKDYTIKGWAMDSERLKNGGSILTEKYFEELLSEICKSNKKLFCKCTVER